MRFGVDFASILAPFGLPLASLWVIFCCSFSLLFSTRSWHRSRTPLQAGNAYKTSTILMIFLFPGEEFLIILGSQNDTQMDPKVLQRRSGNRCRNRSRKTTETYPKMTSKRSPKGSKITSKMVLERVPEPWGVQGGPEGAQGTQKSSK